jgi:hypothetical protein
MQQLIIKPRMLVTLRMLLEDLQRDALLAGRYGPPFTADRWRGRDKRAAFRCVGYERLVRQIGALEDAIAVLAGLQAKEQGHAD